MPGLVALLVATPVAALVIKTLFLPLTIVVFLAVAAVVYAAVERMTRRRSL